MRNALYILLVGISLQINAQTLTGDVIETNKGMVVVHPILHGTLALEFDKKIIIIDPYGGEEAMEGIPDPDLILITDIHGDHHNPKTLEILNTLETQYIVPQAVADKMNGYDNLTVLNNGEETKFDNIKIKAVPMYNLPETADSRHTKGRGNGYVITMAGVNVYVSGDTDDIDEMRSLKNIDVAFICMNQPFTMTVDQAADAVLSFKPKVVYPYHYRGRGGLSDVAKFKNLVNEKDEDIEVRLTDWYPEN